MDIITCLTCTVNMLYIVRIPRLNIIIYCIHMKNLIQQQLGKQIQYLRKIHGYSQEAFAEKIGIATNTLSSIERGNAFMTAQTLENITKVLNIQPKELFIFSEYTNDEDIYSTTLRKISQLQNNRERLIILNKLIDALL